MNGISRALLCACAAMACALAQAGDATACSVCLAGDPRFSSHGAQAQESGSISATLEVRGWKKTSGLLPHGEEEGHSHEEGHEHDDEGEEEEEHHGDDEERNTSQRVDLYVSWTPIDRVTLSVDVPYAFNEIVEDEGGKETRSTLSGFGDLAFTASTVLWRNRDILPSTWVEGQVFLKTPTGKSRQHVDGIRDPHLQVGTGSWDVGFGLAAAHRLDWGSLYTSVFYRENTEGSLDYEYGDVVLGNFAVEVAPGHVLGSSALDRITLGTELNFRYAGFDEVDGERFEDSGGAILYFTPSIRVELPWFEGRTPPALRTSVQIPLGQTWLHNQQREKEVWSVGLQYRF